MAHSGTTFKDPWEVEKKAKGPLADFDPSHLTLREDVYWKPTPTTDNPIAQSIAMGFGIGKVLRNILGRIKEKKEKD
jgi:hypothetical protein